MVKSSDHTKLDLMSTKFPFHAPEGYFHDLPSKIMEKIGDETRPAKKLFFIRNVKPILGFAASFLIIVSIFYFSGRVFSFRKVDTVQALSFSFDEEFLISYPLADNAIYETLENIIPDDPLDSDQLESVLLASVTEYELIDLNN